MTTHRDQARHIMLGRLAVKLMNATLDELLAALDALERTGRDTSIADGAAEIVKAGADVVSVEARLRSEEIEYGLRSMLRDDR